MREIGDGGGIDHALVFEAKVDGLAITGRDFLRYDDAGKIADFMVMVRPLRAPPRRSRSGWRSGSRRSRRPRRGLSYSVELSITKR